MGMVPFFKKMVPNMKDFGEIISSMDMEDILILLVQHMKAYLKMEN